MSVLNRGDEILRNLTVDYRFDSSKTSVQGVRNGTAGANQVTWTIASLNPGEKWEESFGLKASTALENGAIISSSVTVLGEDVSGVPTSQRSASKQLSVIKMLPKTGVPLDLLFFLVSGGTSTLVTVVGGVRRIRRR